MINIQDVMDDVRLALEVAAKGHVCEHQFPDDRLEDMVVKVRALISPAFNKIQCQHDDIMDYQQEVEELQEKILELEDDVEEREEEEERKAIQSIFDRIFNQCEKKVGV